MLDQSGEQFRFDERDHESLLYVRDVLFARSDSGPGLDSGGMGEALRRLKGCRLKTEVFGPCFLVHHAGVAKHQKVLSDESMGSSESTASPSSEFRVIFGQLSTQHSELLRLSRAASVPGQSAIIADSLLPSHSPSLCLEGAFPLQRTGSEHSQNHCFII